MLKRCFQFRTADWEPIDVRADSEEEAWPLYEIAFKKDLEEINRLARERGQDATYFDEQGEEFYPKTVTRDNTWVKEVGQPENKWLPRLICCDKANEINKWGEYKGPHIQLQIYEEDYDKDELFINPRWSFKGMVIQFCPFCGTKMPEVEELKNKPTPMWAPGGPRCGTCDERNGHGWCTCNPPASGYKLKDS